MEITYFIIIALVTYVLGAITKLKIKKIPNKYIPIQNVIIGVVAALICWALKIKPPVESFVLCLLATTGAGGIADLLNQGNYKIESKTEDK